MHYFHLFQKELIENRPTSNKAVLYPGNYSISFTNISADEGSYTFQIILTNFPPPNLPDTQNSTLPEDEGDPTKTNSITGFSVYITIYSSFVIVIYFFKKSMKKKG